MNYSSWIDKRLVIILFILMSGVELVMSQPYNNEANNRKNERKMKNKIIYVMDPQCGWCYGNSQNITSLYNDYLDKYDFEILCGGMWIGENAPISGQDISSYIVSQLPRLESVTGMNVSKEFQELISNSNYVLSSLEPSAAIVLMKEHKPEIAFQFAKEVQALLFVGAKRLNEIETYIPLLSKYDVDKDWFQKNWLSVDNLKKTNIGFERARSMANGFPTLLIENNGEIKRLASGYFDIDEVKVHMNKMVNN